MQDAGTAARPCATSTAVCYDRRQPSRDSAAASTNTCPRVDITWVEVTSPITAPLYNGRQRLNCSSTATPVSGLQAVEKGRHQRALIHGLYIADETVDVRVVGCRRRQAVHDGAAKGDRAWNGSAVR
jgi:hypothetical protein